MKFYDRELEKLNKKYILYEVINLFFSEIKNINYENALNIYINNNIVIIFILILIKKIIINKMLNNLLILSLFE